MKKTKLIAGVGIAAVTLLAGCSAQSPSSNASATSVELQTVNVGTVPLALFAPLFIADAKGYFADEGIELNIQTVTSGQDAIPLTANGQLDVLIAGFSAGMFNAMSAGLEVKVVGSMAISDGVEENPAAALLVNSALSKSGDVNDLADLKGRSVAVAGGIGGSGAYFVGAMLDSVGLNLSDITLVNLGNADMPTALGNEGVDAAFNSVPYNTKAVADGNAVTLAVPAEGMCSTGVIYGEEFTKSDLAQPFFNALARGSQDVQDGHVYDEDNLKIVAEATGQELDTLRETPMYIWLPTLAPLPEQLSGMEEVWLNGGALNYSDPLKADTYIDAKFSEDIN